MEVHIQDDRLAHRRHNRANRLFLLAAVLYLPATTLILLGLRLVLGRAVLGPYAAAVFFAGFVTLALIWLGGVRDAVRYRCPQCGKRLPRCRPWNDPEPNLHYHCEHCRIVWNLGWGFTGGGGVGG